MTNHLSSIIGVDHTFFQVEDDIFIDDSLITNRTFTHYNSFILTDDCLSGWTVLSACGATKTVIGKKKKKNQATILFQWRLAAFRAILQLLRSKQRQTYCVIERFISIGFLSTFHYDASHLEQQSEPFSGKKSTFSGGTVMVDVAPQDYLSAITACLFRCQLRWSISPRPKAFVIQTM